MSNASLAASNKARLHALLPSLSSAQMAAFKLVESGRNVFLTGPAGTGKSYLLECIRLDKAASKAIALTATTGQAASRIGGTTIHSFAGLGKGDGTKEELLGRVRGNAKALQRWKDTDILVIDEISMMSCELFDKAEYIAGQIRGKSDVFFGGIQVIVCGDFFQLPPVNDYKDRNKPPKYAFKSEVWKSMFVPNDNIIELTLNFRQEGNHELMRILNRIRYGIIRDRDLGVFAQTAIGKIDAKGNLLPTKDGIEPTLLFCQNKGVDEYNEMRLSALPGAKTTFFSKDWTVDDAAAKKMDAACSLPDRIQLAVGAQVVLLANLNVSENLFNGSRGVVEAIEMRLDPTLGVETPTPMVRFIDAKEAIPIYRYTVEGRETRVAKGAVAEPIWTRAAVPLRLAWAMTIHKCQGQTLDLVAIRIAQAFAPGQAYVALSRSRSIASLIVLDIHPSKIMADPLVVDYYRSFSKAVVEEDDDDGEECGENDEEMEEYP
jgi:ATP-dependent DNA helicase PIF1